MKRHFRDHFFIARERSLWPPAQEGEDRSLLRAPGWCPTLGPGHNTFSTVDLLLYACENKAELLQILWAIAAVQ